MVVAFAAHFRPWNNGILEDWGFVAVWAQSGIDGFWPILQATAGRPFHVVPHFIGLALSNGGFTGMYFVLGVVAILQVAATAWAVRPLLGWSAYSCVVGVVLALHPWWMAGDLIRFLPAQVSALAFIVWFGCACRFMVGRQDRWLWGMFFAPAVGLLVYQALALVYVLGVVATVVLVHPRRRDAARAILTTLASVIFAAIYSLVVAPALFGANYETALIANRLDALGSISYVLRTLVTYGEGLIALMIAVTTGWVILAVRRRASTRRYLLLACFAPLGVVSALAYAGSSLHLNDPDRVLFPIGTGAWFGSLLLLVAANYSAPVLPPQSTASSDHRSTTRFVAATVVVAATLAGAVSNIISWEAYASLQTQTLELVDRVVAVADEDEMIVVADSSGRLGDVYTFYPPHLDIASQYEHGPNAEAVICTTSGTDRLHEVASRYPISTTPDCSAVVTPDARKVATGAIGDGLAEVYVQRRPGIQQ